MFWRERIPGFSDSEPKAPSFGVEEQGAYITKLWDSHGRNVIFPKTEINGKARGGSHVCLPGFGPDEAGVYSQHGFGRDVLWQRTSDADTDIRLEYTEHEGDYKGLSARIDYQLSPDSFSTTLWVDNSSDVPLAISPGFHPYFEVEGSVLLNGEPIDVTAYETPQIIIGTDKQVLQTSNHTIEISSYDLNTWVIWTDLRGGYLCVEPTLNGPGFNSQKPHKNELLQPGEVRDFSYLISWGDHLD